ncbi:MAG: nucleotidyltransferase [Chloroflexi bacterium]|nr:nucleotidyltransferase [Chloroflexota bacterium]
MELRNEFNIFLKEIRPTDSMQSDLQSGHRILRQRLRDDAELQNVIVSDFLQGSYRRSTAVRPKNGKRSDVDIIVVTKFAESQFTPQEAMNLFVPFLNRYYKNKWRPQGRSFGIELSYVDIDLVITSAPSESEYNILQSESVTAGEDIDTAIDWRFNQSWVSLTNRGKSLDSRILLERAKEQPEWKSNPLRIPDRNTNTWEDTHPLEQIRWTHDMNRETNGNFVNIVKCAKWWWLGNFDEPQHPKGFPLERIIGDCCPSGIESVAEGIVLTLEKIVSKYGIWKNIKGKPQLFDYGVPTHDVLKRLTSEDFGKFYDRANKAASIARKAYNSSDRVESGELWRELLGTRFPQPSASNGSKNSGYSSPTEPAAPGSGRFA